jgi:hypothetical protein
MTYILETFVGLAHHRGYHKDLRDEPPGRTFFCHRNLVAEKVFITPSVDPKWENYAPPGRLVLPHKDVTSSD